MFKWDVFISHASEDKPSFVRHLALELQTFGLSVWYDEFSLSPGDSLSRSIDKGLIGSRYGVLVLSPAFLNKAWPDYELRGLVMRDQQEGNVIIPVWFNLTEQEVLKFSPTLADRIAIVTDGSNVRDVALELLKRVNNAEYERSRLEERILRYWSNTVGPTHEITERSRFFSRSFKELEVEALSPDGPLHAALFVVSSQGTELKALKQDWWHEFYSEMILFQPGKWRLPVRVSAILTELPVEFDARRAGPVSDAGGYIVNMEQRRHDTHNELVIVDRKDLTGFLIDRIIVAEIGSTAEEELKDLLLVVRDMIKEAYEFFDAMYW